MGRRRNGVITVWGGAVGWRSLAWCSVGGIAFMFLTSIGGVISSVFVPDGWTRVRVLHGVEAEHPQQLWQIGVYSSVGWTDTECIRLPQSTPDVLASWAQADNRLPRHAVSPIVRRGTPFARVHAPGANSWRLYAAGWLFRAWRGGHWSMDDASGVSFRAANLRHIADPTGRAAMGYTVPYGPVWSGIVLNSLVGAVGIWASVVLPVAIRRARRRGRGLCVACGYDLAGVDGVVCPECGGRQAAIGARVRHGRA